jgi:hypothetical protein
MTEIPRGEIEVKRPDPSEPTDDFAEKIELSEVERAKVNHYLSGGGRRKPRDTYAGP